MQLVQRLPSPLAPSSASSAVVASLASLLSSLASLQAALPLPRARIDESPTQRLVDDDDTDTDMSASDSDALWSRVSSLSASASAASEAAIEAWHAQGLSAAASSLRALNASPVAQVSAMLATDEGRRKLTSRALGDGDTYDDEELFHALLKELMLVGQQSGQEALTGTACHVNAPMLSLY